MMWPRLRSVTGSLAWVSRQTRPDLGYRVSRLQSSISGATVAIFARRKCRSTAGTTRHWEQAHFSRWTSNLGRGWYHYSNRCFIFKREELQITTRTFSIFLETSMRSKTPRLHPTGWCHWDLHQIQFGEYAAALFNAKLIHCRLDKRAVTSYVEHWPSWWANLTRWKHGWMTAAAVFHNWCFQTAGL